MGKGDLESDMTEGKAVDVDDEKEQQSATKRVTPPIVWKQLRAVTMGLRASTMVRKEVVADNNFFPSRTDSTFQN